MPPASPTTATPGMERADQYKRFGKGNPSNKYYYTILGLAKSRVADQTGKLGRGRSSEILQIKKILRWKIT